MANENKISVVISADPSGAITGIRMVGDETEKLGTRTQSLTQRLQSHWAEVTVGIYAAYAAFQQIWGLMEKAAQIDEAMRTLDALTRQYGMTAQDLVGKIQQASNGLIGMQAAASVANDALLKGFTPEQIASMASWSVTLSHASAGTQSAAEAFKLLETSMTAARERGAVKLLGTAIDLKDQFGAYADTMSKAEKAQAIFTMASERVAQIQATIGEETDSAADRMVRFTNSVEKAKYFLGELLLVIGQPLMAIFQVAMTLVYGLAGAFDTLVSEGAQVTDWLGVTEGATEQWAKKADKAYGNAAQSAMDALANIKGALASLGDMGKVGGVPLPGMNTSGNRKQMDELTALYRKYIEEKDLASTNEYDREFIRLNKWYDDQVKKLDDLHAAKKYYDAMYADYSAKWGEAKIARDKKLADMELKAYEETQKRKLELAQATAKASLDAQEQRIRAEQELNALAVKSGHDTESQGIKDRAASERALLEIQRQRNWLAMDALSIEGEFVGTNAQLLEILGKEKVLQDQIATSKTLEAYELNTRRLQLETEIADLIKQQRDMVQQINVSRAQEALNKIGANTLGANVGLLSDINAKQDPYTKDFERWSALQDQKIMKLEEMNATKAELDAAWREYDLQAEATQQAQKVAMAGAGFGMMASLAEGFYNLSGQKGGAAFEVMKAFRIGETVMNTYSAAVGAYNAMASIPFVGPALGVAAAAAAIAFGMAQVRAITSMKPGGAAVSASVGAGGVSVPVLPAAPAPAPATQATTGSPTVNIHIYGNVVDHDKFARELVPAITKAIGDGVQ